jgi:transcriptional regulator GlxA family with amidase domain
MSKTASSDVAPSTCARIVIVLFPGTQPLDAVGPADVFEQATVRSPGSYEVVYAAQRTSVRLTPSLEVHTTTFDALELSAADTLLVPGGTADGLTEFIADTEAMSWLTDAAAGAGRTVSVCTGAFVLAALGLLAGRTATTHWAAWDLLAAYEPAVEIDREAIFVQDGDVWTSAGVAAGIDLALAIVRADLGADVALSVSRDMVVPLVRAGGQAAFATTASREPDDGDLGALLTHIHANLSRNLHVSDIALAVGMSPRTLHRHCVERYGTTPARLVADIRLESARVALLATRSPLRRIAHDVGYADESAFSKAFSRRFAMSPSRFRAGFAAIGDDTP